VPRAEPDGAERRSDRLLEVGRVAKPHGLRGEVVVALTTNRPERVAKGTVLHTDQGPLTITASRPHQNRYIVRFAGVDSREAADAIHGLVLSAEPLDDPDVLWVHELIGSVVVDQHGTGHGTVTSVELNPASDLLVLEGGGLVPLTFVVEQGDGRITVDVPDGLLD
jgi:16S rRNA processing protein RimM